MQEFRRLGVEGDWKNYYSTMSFDAEAQIVRELGKFLLDDSLYQGYKPVLWSTVEKTALADAEVEYKDHTSNTIYVGFKVKDSKINIHPPPETAGSARNWVRRTIAWASPPPRPSRHAGKLPLRKPRARMPSHG